MMLYLISLDVSWLVTYKSVRKNIMDLKVNIKDKVK